MSSADDRLRAHLAGLAPSVEALLSAAWNGDEQALAAMLPAATPGAWGADDGDAAGDPAASYQATLLLDAAGQAAERIGEDLAKLEALAALHARRLADAEADARAARAQLRALERAVVVPLVSRFGRVPPRKNSARLDGEAVTCRLERTRPHVVVDPAAIPLLPAECRRVRVEADKEAIKARLDRGDELPGCVMQPGDFRVKWGRT